MGNTNNKIANAITYIKELIEGTKWNGKVYVVGGCVRDIIMGNEPKDLDIVVNQEHGGVAFATWLACRTSCYKMNTNPVIFPTYGTAKLQITTNSEIADVEIECVQTRKEQYHKESRNPDTAFGTIEEDAARRDLTINALYLNISTGEILDLNGQGMKDIQNHVIRCTNDADIIFNDDPLRQLRVIRFATRFGWGIEKNTWLGIVKNAYRMSIISQERITDEINKILVTDKPSDGIRRLYYSGLLGMVLPEIKDLVGLTQNEKHTDDAFEHTMSVLDKTQPILINRLAALFHDVAKARVRSEYNNTVHFYCHEDVGATMCQDIMRRMKYSNEDIKAVATIVKNHMKFKQFKDYRVPSNKVLRRFHATVGEYLDAALDVIDADNHSHAKDACLPNQITLIKERYKQLEEKGENTSKIVLPINGKDVMETLGMRNGNPKVGKYLEIIKDAYLENPNISKDECISLIKETAV